MGSNKTIRDPMYGYIKIDYPFTVLIDTEEFQRLRNIRQTGYQSLYPSALHNRFVHSLGVFHLGREAFHYFSRNVKASLEEEWNSIDNQMEIIKNTFYAACLLHDVGHSPFSHTGETYYTKGCDFRTEYQQVFKLTDERSTPEENLLPTRFFEDLDNSKDSYGKPHEAMSSLIGLELCSKFYIPIDNDLFVRAIIGLKYKSNYSPSNFATVFKNSIIGLLNGDLIDVDKLDYVVRDAYVTGYNSLTLDIERLLSGYTIAKPGADEYEVAFKKGALSVIENVIFANDLERRWIQSHPSILYDCWLVDGLLVQFDEYMRNVAPMTPDGNKPAQKPSTVFTKDALSSQGVQGLVAPLRLLCDDDIICYAKNIDNSFYGKQYFSRKDRFKPLWKTEASYENLTNGVFGDRFLSEITSSLRCLISPQAEGVLINQNFIDSINKQLEKAEKAELSTASYTTSLGICDIFKKFKEENSLPDFEFVVLFTRKFQSAYKKDGLNQMKLELETGLVPIKDVLSVQAKEASQQTNSNLFYVYTTESNLRRQSDLGKNFIDCLRRQYKRQL